MFRPLVSKGTAATSAREEGRILRSTVYTAGQAPWSLPPGARNSPHTDGVSFLLPAVAMTVTVTSSCSPHGVRDPGHGIIGGWTATTATTRYAGRPSVRSSPRGISLPMRAYGVRQPCSRRPHGASHPLSHPPTRPSHRLGRLQPPHARSIASGARTPRPLALSRPAEGAKLCNGGCTLRTIAAR